MKRRTYLPFLIAVLGTAFGGGESTASRSAAAYDGAQRSGHPIGTSTTEGHGHSETMGSPVPPGHEGHEMPAAEPDGAADAGHHDHAGSDSANSAEGHAGHGSTTSDPHAGHAMAGATTPDAHAGHVPAAAVPTAQALTSQPGEPGATLRPDSLDAPAQTSVQEAQRASEGAGHHMAHGTYKHVDVGREDVPAAPAATGHAGHAMPGDPHAGHHMPQPTPTPSPEKQEEKP